jgi:hypothetical protein
LGFFTLDEMDSSFLEESTNANLRNIDIFCFVGACGDGGPDGQAEYRV